ncbi:hypothetical protein [Amycolatopsis minnesotensis]|uniref:PE family protein n=1 Tax=Amycolatopsis minnesotensis TaxID=337894 RepID=A0ABN2RMA2_9PSEU
MATAGEDFLRGILGPAERAVGTNTAAPGARSSQVPGEQRHSEAETEVEKAVEEARNEEMSRVADGGTVSLQSVFGTGGPSGAQGGGYHFAPEVTAKKIIEWEQIRDAINEDRWKLQNNAESLLPPSSDQPAADQVRAAKQSILAAVDHNGKMVEYAQAYIDALRKSNGTYIAHEETTISDLHKTVGNSDALHE